MMRNHRSHRVYLHITGNQRNTSNLYVPSCIITNGKQNGLYGLWQVKMFSFYTSEDDDDYEEEDSEGDDDYDDDGDDADDADDDGGTAKAKAKGRKR